MLSSQASSLRQAWTLPQRVQRKLYSPLSTSNADGRRRTTVSTDSPVSGHVIMTRLMVSLIVAADNQLAKVEGRKAIIMLTDGDDTSSKHKYQDGLDAIIRSGAVVYVVSKARLFIEEYHHYPEAVREFERAETTMTDLCNRTGGQIYSPMKDDEMKDVYARVAKELKNQYIITYIPKNEERDGSLRHVKVYLTRPGYSARSRDSYYAPKG